ncbi:MAG TPA: XRE family transcriptional regulator [Ignavibacteria bacterium]|nr:XRE family transcriptional regulator [Ignavibacteria bacterium]
MTTKKIINYEFLEKKLLQEGLNKADLSVKLGLTREAVSKWFRGNGNPSSSKLAKIAKILSLNFDDFIKIEFENSPIVEFRLNRTAKITETKNIEAIDMGNHLKELVKYVPFDYLTKPPILINPEDSYQYIENVVKNIRIKNDFKKDEIEFKQIIALFNNYHSILIPLLWGKNEKKINGLRIFLPDNIINWIYFNLDSNIYDSKFWMLHELGHVIGHDIDKNNSENFANHFAGALLFGEKMSKNLYNELIKLNEPNENITKLIILSKKLSISPLTIYYRLSAYTNEYKLKEIKFDQTLFKRNAGLLRENGTLGETIFGKKKPDSKEFIDSINEYFNTPIFSMLKKYIADTNESASYIQKIFDISYLDAKNIYDCIK